LKKKNPAALFHNTNTTFTAPIEYVDVLKIESINFWDWFISESPANNNILISMVHDSRSTNSCFVCVFLAPIREWGLAPIYFPHLLINFICWCDRPIHHYAYIRTYIYYFSILCEKNHPKIFYRQMQIIIISISILIIVDFFNILLLIHNQLE